MLQRHLPSLPVTFEVLRAECSATRILWHIEEAWKLPRSFEVKKIVDPRRFRCIALLEMREMTDKLLFHLMTRLIFDAENGINKRCLKVPVNLESWTSEHPSAFRHTLQKRFLRISCRLRARSHIFKSILTYNNIFNRIFSQIFFNS